MPMLSFDLTESKVIRAGKIAAALFAAYFAYFLWQTILSYATEPKVIGGLHLDQPLPQTTHWSPVWVPMGLTALFAYGTWPRQIPQGAMRRFFRGSFALLRIELFALFISIFCPGLGGVYLLLPMLTAGEIPSVLVQLVLSSAGTVAIMLTFHFVALIAISIVVGPTILFVTHFVFSRLPATQLDDWPTTRDDASRRFVAFDFAKVTSYLPKISGRPDRWRNHRGRIKICGAPSLHNVADHSLLCCASLPRRARRDDRMGRQKLDLVRSCQLADRLLFLDRPRPARRHLDFPDIRFSAGVLRDIDRLWHCKKNSIQVGGRQYYSFGTRGALLTLARRYIALRPVSARAFAEVSKSSL